MRDGYIHLMVIIWFCFDLFIDTERYATSGFFNP